MDWTSWKVGYLCGLITVVILFKIKYFIEMKINDIDTKEIKKSSIIQLSKEKRCAKCKYPSGKIVDEFENELYVVYRICDKCGFKLYGYIKGPGRDFEWKLGE